MAGRPTITGLDESKGWKGFRGGVWSGGKWFGGGTSSPVDAEGWDWDGGADVRRGWIIAFSWLLVSGAE